MITSRGLSLLKTAYRSSQSKLVATNLRSVRLSHGHGVYRDLPPEDKKWTFVAEVFGGIMWWWILWHFWHDFGHIVGEFPYPDPSKWTDEELGIPPDSYTEPAIRTSMRMLKLCRFLFWYNNKYILPSKKESAKF